MVNSYTHVLHLLVVIAWAHDIVSVSEVGHMDVGYKTELQGNLARLVEDASRVGGECTSLSNAGANLVVLGYQGFGIHRLGNGLNIY